MPDAALSPVSIKSQRHNHTEYQQQQQHRDQSDHTRPHLDAKPQRREEKPLLVSDGGICTAPEASPAIGGSAGQLSSSSSSGGLPQRKKRCDAEGCKKRVGVMGFVCRCGGVFCDGHRYPEVHGCEFDHKSSERRKIAVENPVVRGDKLDKI